MAETSTHTGASMATGFRGHLEMTRLLLRLVYGLVPVVAGLDEFANLLTT